MKVSGDWIRNPATQSVCRMLEQAGFQALFVGGCVRNALLGLAVSDLDLATDARPETVSKLAKNAGLRCIPTGIDHGTVTVMAHGISHEITTFRRDIDTDGRHAVVAFSTSVAEDAQRRDFTMNALYARGSGEVLDPLGGLPDVLSRRVRFVGVPAARISEDYLRILRFFRFQAWYGDPSNGLDAEGLAACAANIAGLETLSAERIGAEMRKLLSAPDPAFAVSAMGLSGVLAAVLQGADTRALPVFLHLVADLPRDWIARLVVLGGADPTERLRLSRTESAKYHLVRDEIGSLRRPAELAYRLGAAQAAQIVLARSALMESPPPKDWRADIAMGGQAVFPVAAADLMPALQGPVLGEKLRVLEARWIDSGFELSKDQLLS